MAAASCPRRTIRELQEWRCKATEAGVEAQRLIDRWDEETITTHTIATEQRLEEEDQAMAQAVETLREWLCNSGRAVGVKTPPINEMGLLHTCLILTRVFCVVSIAFQQLAYIFLCWGKWRIDHGRCHRAVPLLLKAVDIWKQNSASDCPPNLIACLDLLGAALRSVGRLEEAEAALLDAIALSTTSEDQGFNISAQCNLVETYLEMEDVANAVEWALKVHQELETYQHGVIGYLLWGTRLNRRITIISTQ